MASNTKQTRFIRKNKAKKAGADRKRAIRKNGSTPAFEIHSEAAVKNAPKAQLKAE